MDELKQRAQNYVIRTAVFAGISICIAAAFIDLFSPSIASILSDNDAELVRGFFDKFQFVIEVSMYVSGSALVGLGLWCHLRFFHNITRVNFGHRSRPNIQNDPRASNELARASGVQKSVLSVDSLNVEPNGASLIEDDDAHEMRSQKSSILAGPNVLESRADVEDEIYQLKVTNIEQETRILAVARNFGVYGRADDVDRELRGAAWSAALNLLLKLLVPLAAGGLAAGGLSQRLS